MVELHLGDCLDILKTLPDISIDALITDPPAGIAFMGKSWDSDKGGRNAWILWMRERMEQCYRVMKPGAHGLVWALPRTSHWTATALEDAGFEVRDTVVHLFGTGFPKSLDVSKAIDKAAGAEREVVGHLGGRYSTPKQDIRGGNFVGSDKPSIDVGVITAPATPAARQWQGWGTALKPAHENWILIRKRYTVVTPFIEESLALCNEIVQFAGKNTPLIKHGLEKEPAKPVPSHAQTSSETEPDPTAQSTKAADGNGATDISPLPQAESLILLNTVSSWREYLEDLLSLSSRFTTETVTSQITVLKTLNCSLSLITQSFMQSEAPDQAQRIRSSVLRAEAAFSVLSLVIRESGYFADGNVSQSEHAILIRKPLGEKTVAANVLKHGTGALNIDACRIESIGGLTKGGACVGNSALHMNKEAGVAEARARSQEHQQGRFPANLVLSDAAAAALDEHSLAGGMHSAGAARQGKRKAQVPGIFGLAGGDGHRLGDAGGASRFFYCAKACRADRGPDNRHPTVKSTKLMEYLITLITPPGGTVLDPFLGSGSTGVAAKRLGFEFVGIEESAEYLAIAELRVKDVG